MAARLWSDEKIRKMQVGAFLLGLWCGIIVMAALWYIVVVIAT